MGGRGARVLPAPNGSSFGRNQSGAISSVSAGSPEYDETLYTDTWTHANAGAR